MKDLQQFGIHFISFNDEEQFATVTRQESPEDAYIVDFESPQLKKRFGELIIPIRNGELKDFPFEPDEPGLPDISHLVKAVRAAIIKALQE